MKWMMLFLETIRVTIRSVLLFLLFLSILGYIEFLIFNHWFEKPDFDPYFVEMFIMNILILFLFFQAVKIKKKTHRRLIVITTVAVIVILFSHIAIGLKTGDEDQLLIRHNADHLNVLGDQCYLPEPIRW